MTALSDTQLLILRMIEDGSTTGDIAEHLGVSYETARGKVRKIKRQFPGVPIGDLPGAARASGADF